MIPLNELYTGRGEKPIGLAPDEVLIEIEVPPQPGAWDGEYEKLRYRGAMDYPLLGVATVLGRQGEECARARIVLTAVAPAPMVIEEGGQLLQGEQLDEAIISRAAEVAYEAVRPIACIGSTPLYRHKMVRVLTRRAIARAWGGD
jgi:CO/xanthine dehydrogenase FAD-binding subunit